MRIGDLEIVVTDSLDQMSAFAAEFIFDGIRRKPDLLICAATGSTPTTTYRLLAKKFTERPQAFERIRVVKLDEWGGIPMDDPATCEVYLRQHLISPLNVDASRFISFHSNPEHPKQEAGRVAAQLEQEGPIYLCVLGMGLNGHVGFNEPARSLQSNAHVAMLAEETRQHRMAQAAKHEIQYGLTLGMDDIMRSRRILLLVSGPHKRLPFNRSWRAK